ncbi:transcription regulator HTH, apses-type DNA-binding domain-containing protein, partial [Gaertneriomyces semiglobifer]
MSVTTPPIPTLQPSLSTSAAPTTPTNLSAPTTPVSNNFPHSYRSANIRTASYSGVRVYEIQCRGVPVMRRVADAYINATQILRAAGLPKPQRTKILERDVTGGVHEKVQGGYAGFQGTWIPLDSARMLARAHGVERDMDDLLSY